MSNDVEARLAALLRAASALEDARSVEHIAALASASDLGAPAAALWVVDGVTATLVRTRDAADEVCASIACGTTSALVDAVRSALGDRGRTAKCLSLASGDGPLGVVAFFADERRTFTPADELSFELYAVHLTSALERVRRLRAEERHGRAQAKLMAKVVHDMRNPLGVAQLKTEVMQRRLPQADEGEQLRKDLRVIARNCELVSELIGDLLDVVTIEAGLLVVERESLAIAEILAAAVESAGPRANAGGIELTTRSRLDGETVLCDRERILQVFAKLLANAMKFSPAGGRVTIEAHADPEGVSFVIADEGPGIAPEERDHVFDPWSRGATRATKQGAGLGLYIARGVVNAHSGRIWIDTASETGARVAFTLPRA